ncbi:hypothetical protein HW555_013893 [Spodoptera exigua]|uniref:Uncharacterized protein n=1 Tax=Spodoptera exigua TaxID=7107 RepID=A0A835KWI8_SPOEX|nr:hypothetical protein HW555_013893 [Spodoptera exigua]
MATLRFDEPLRSDNYESHLQPPELLLHAIENIQHDTDFNIKEVHPPNDMANTLLESADIAHCNVSSEPVAPDTATAAVQEVVVNTDTEQSFPDDILEILGEALLRDTRFGPALNSSIPVRWEHGNKWPS